MIKNLRFEKIDDKNACQESNGNLVAKFVLEPLQRGFGTTLGNALRRVLLSSIPGAALVNVEIEGVQHEFSTIDGVFEDVVGIVLNLKGIIFKVEDQDPEFSSELELNVSDKEIVTAEDFKLPAGVEIINKDHVICHLNKGTSLKMTALLRKGVGYVSNSENKKYDQRIGVISIDSIYNPVVRTTFNVEKLQGDKDQLILEVETNGSIEAKEAVSIASAMLIEHFEEIKRISDMEHPVSYFDAVEEVEEEPDSNLELHKLDLPVRVYNALARAGIKTVGQLLQKTPDELSKIRSLGKKSQYTLTEKLKEYGYKNLESVEFNDDEDQINDADLVLENEVK